MNRAPLSRQREGAAGFTLIELLVVVLIIGIVMSFVTLSLNPTGPAGRLQTEATRLAALTAAAADDAVLYGRQLGLEITPSGYRFLRLGQNGWRPITDRDSPLRPRRLGPDLALAPINAGPNGQNRPRLLRPNLGGRPNGGDANKPRPAARPDAVFLSSGEIVPFTLELSASGVAQRFELTGRANGTMAMRKIGGAR